jgi:hypothetical protein
MEWEIGQWPMGGKGGIYAQELFLINKICCIIIHINMYGPNNKFKQPEKAASFTRQLRFLLYYIFSPQNIVDDFAN